MRSFDAFIIDYILGQFLHIYRWACSDRLWYCRATSHRFSFSKTEVILLVTVKHKIHGRRDEFYSGLLSKMDINHILEIG